MWLQKALADGPKLLVAIQKEGTARGHSWRTTQRCRKELQIGTLFSQNMYWWVLPGHTGLVGPGAFAPVEAAPEPTPEPEPEPDTFENLVVRLNETGKIGHGLEWTIPEIVRALEREAYSVIKTKLPEADVNRLIAAFAEQHKPDPPIWERADWQSVMEKASSNKKTEHYYAMRSQMVKDNPPEIEQRMKDIQVWYRADQRKPK
ncbi:MAG: hypothetical protein ACREBW_07355 [Candidatus Micrarchaeaceae archaeon]